MLEFKHMPECRFVLADTIRDVVCSVSAMFAMGIETMRLVRMTAEMVEAFEAVMDYVRGYAGDAGNAVIDGDAQGVCDALQTWLDDTYALERASLIEGSEA